MALQYPLGVRSDMAPEQVGGTREAAIGDQDGAAAESDFAVLTPRCCPGAAAARHAQRHCLGAKEYSSLALLKPLLELAEHQVRPAPAPILAGHWGAWRRQRPEVPADLARAGEVGAVA